jgi:hypothetical protein
MMNLAIEFFGKYISENFPSPEERYGEVGE